MRRLAPVILAISTFVAQADILHLRDGSRHYGTLISQDERQVVFRIRLEDGASSVVKRFPAAVVQRVERGGPMPAPAPTVKSSSGARPSEDFEQMLREAFELLDDGDLAAALRALQRTVVRSPKDRRPQLDKQCRAARGVPLADLLADVRIRDALDRNGFRVKFATPYERPALGRLLEARVDRLLAKEYHGRSIADWSGQPDAYKTLRADARQMVSDARHAAGMLGVRVRFDPRLEQDWDERQRLIRLRSALARFVAHVTALPGYTDPPEGDDVNNPAAAVARRLARGQQPATQPAESEQDSPDSTPAFPEP